VRKSHIPICYVVWNAEIMKLKTDMCACSLVNDNDIVSMEIGEEIKFSAECYGLSSCAHDVKETCLCGTVGKPCILMLVLNRPYNEKQ
jgi:hypothetical protein